jgi:hypothetical protein
MAKFNQTPKRDKDALRKETRPPVTGTGPLGTKKKATTTTFEGAPAFVPRLKTELFQLAVSNMVGERSFYESAGDRDSRFTSLVRQVAVKDPAWLLGFVGFLRNKANMRSASIVAAVEGVKARLDAKAPSVPAYEVPGHSSDRGLDRVLIDAACQRADEPGELLAYWLANHGRSVPKPVKRGLADAAARLYSEYTLLKYDTASHGVRFGDVLDLTHPTPATPDQGTLFRYALDRRHGRTVVLAHMPPMVRANADLRDLVTKGGEYHHLLSPEVLSEAGMTWEDALSLAGSKVDKAKLWEAMIPNMGIMALIRNLRNFDEAGVSYAAATQVIERLHNPVQIEKSRQLPFRFYTAYTQAPSDRWKYALGVALDLACANVPALPGRTLVLIDTSASMTNCTISDKSKVTPAEAAAVLGIVLAKRVGADVYGFATKTFKHDLVKGQTAMQGVKAFLDRTGEAGHSTEIHRAIRERYDRHDRVFVLSDMQCMGGGYIHYASEQTDIGGLIPTDKIMYSFNLNGYRATPMSTGKPNRHALAGFSDSTFQLVPLLEAGESPDWDALFGTAAPAGRSTVPESYDSGGVWTVS